MKLKIAHRTQYQYDAPVGYGLQRIRLTPLKGRGQKVSDWSIAVEGAREEVRFIDQFGNDTMLLSLGGAPQTIAVEAAGIVETTDNAGVVGPHTGFAPLWLFEQQTALTAPSDEITKFADGVAGDGSIDRLHNLMHALADRIAYEPGTTGVGTTAQEAFAAGQGVCQDHAHIFIACARRFGFPARYVSGYLLLDDRTEQAASHGWAEAHVDPLGWVAFDVANRISPDERYVRLAVGRDYRDAAPVMGIRLGQAVEHLAVAITVEQ